MARQVSCRIYHSAQWRDYVQRGYLFYCIISNEKNLVYSAPNATPLPLSEKQHLKQSVDAARQLFLVGHSKAQVFLTNVPSVLEVGDLGIAAFMLHQSAELNLRYFILSLTGLDCKTHSMRVLLRHMERYAPHLRSFLPGGNDKENQLLQILEQAYLDSRYKEDFEVLPKQIETITQRVASLLEATLLAFDDLVMKATG